MTSKVPPSTPPATSPEYSIAVKQASVPIAHAVPVNESFTNANIAGEIHCHPKPPPQLSGRPTLLECPYCHHTMVTRTRDRIGACTVGTMFALFLFCCPFFWIPLCCRNVSVRVYECILITIMCTTRVLKV